MERGKRVGTSTRDEFTGAVIIDAPSEALGSPMHIRARSLVTRRRAALATAATAWLLAGASISMGPARPTEVDFNRDIRPILSDRCFKCHGFDARARKAKLRLDTWEGLTTPRKNGQPVVPGDPDGSLLVVRIHAEDPDDVMPPANSGLSLSAEEKTLIRRWIEQGARFAPHWGFVAPRLSEPPAVQDSRGLRNAIDRFVQAPLEHRGLDLSPEADAATLIRRLSLDLTGLPPTPEEVDAFVADDAAGAYDRLVERLLASPRFGERMALVWLDAARYADTNGFHHDNVRTAWPYRDWVIRAFNDNMPFDEFVVEQLAGDLLDGATEQQRIASGFCRMHNINDEGGALDEEYRVEAVCDRIETISTTFMGLTMTCARCHDHKYDPLTQDDYYSLYAFFNSVDERGVYPNNGEQARAYPARLLYRPDDLGQRMTAAEAERDAAKAAVAAAQPDVEREQVAWEQALRAERGIDWADAQLIGAASAEGASVERKADGSVLFGAGHATDTYTFELRTMATGLRLLRFEALTDPSMKGRIGLAANGNAVVTAIDLVAESVLDPSRRSDIDWIWVWSDHDQPNGDYDAHNLLQPGKRGWALHGHGRAEPRNALLLSDAPFGFEGGTVLRVTVECRGVHADHVVGRPRLSVARASADVLDEFPVVASDWWIAAPFVGGDFDALYDRTFGPEEVRELDLGQSFGEVAWRHHPEMVDGVTHALSGERTAFYLARTLHTPVERQLELSLGSDDALQVFCNGEMVLANKTQRGVSPDQDHVTVTLHPGANIVVLKVVNDGGPAGVYYEARAQGGALDRLGPAAFVPQRHRGEALDAAFAREWGVNRSPTFARLQADAEKLDAAVAELEGQQVPVLVMSELPEPTETFVLARGSYDAPNRERPVGRRPPVLLGEELPVGAPDNRLGFARWLVRPDHPLTARVHVNRLWQMLFGTGIVTSLENFGQQADWPSHLELLDWLAVRFVESGWDQKELLRWIVSSATYRQSAVIRPEARELDPRNRWLAYFPRRRLAAEMIRDQALFVAGLLAERRGGPSVRPYQPPGLWREVSIGGSSNTQVFARDNGEALYRRSLYTFWKRTAPSPQMRVFDAPTREFCVVRRNTTNTPLQALVLWNDVQFLEAARVLAQRMLQEAAGEERLALLFRRCTGGAPDGRALAVLKRTLAGFVERYRADPAAAAALLQQGEAPLPAAYDAVELAAWMMMASTVLNLDATLVCD